MSWFDKLFGEENDPNKDYLNKRNQRRQKSQEHQDTLLPQNNDVYERPKGKFRFPMRVLEENSETEDAINGKSENEFKILTINQLVTKLRITATEEGDKWLMKMLQINLLNHLKNHMQHLVVKQMRH